MKRSCSEIQFTPLFHRFIVISQGSRSRKINGARLSNGTIIQYKTCEKILLAFEQVNNIRIRIRPLNRLAGREFQIEKRYWEKFFRAFSNFLYNKRKCSDQYVASIFKIIRTFFNYLVIDKALSVGPFYRKFRIPIENVPVVVLSPGRLRFLIQSREFRDQLPTACRRTRDIFIFGCTVGLRFSDLMSLRRNSIVSGENGKFLQINTRKTGRIVKIPLPDYALEIIELYKGKAGQYLLPRISLVNLNLQLKKLMQRAGWTESLPKFRMQNGKLVEIKTRTGTGYRFCDHISSHTMRRTAITTLLILGVPELVVRKISGHAPGSKEFYRYVAIAEDYLEKEVRKAQSYFSLVP